MAYQFTIKVELLRRQLAPRRTVLQRIKVDLPEEVPRGGGVYNADVLVGGFLGSGDQCGYEQFCEVPMACGTICLGTWRAAQ